MLAADAGPFCEMPHTVLLGDANIPMSYRPQMVVFDWTGAVRTAFRPPAFRLRQIRGARRVMFGSRRLRTLGFGATAVTLATLAGSIPIAVAAAPTQAQYIAEADAICQATDHQAAPYAAQYDGALKSRKAAALKKGRQILLRATAIDQRGLTKVEALPRPAGDKQALAAVWEASTMRLQVTRRFARAISPLNESALSEDEKGLQFDEARYHQLAKSYGFQVCGAKQKASG